MKDTKEKLNETNPVQVNVPEIYSNAALVNISPYEFEITLGLGSSNYEGVKPVVNLRLSPQYAKEFADILTRNVELYEESFGEIKIPEEVK